MNKNNFLAKFAHYYIGNFNGIKDKIVNVWDFIKDNFEDLFIIAITPLALIISLISIVLPIKQIILASISVYLTDEDLEKLAPYKDSGYYTKASIKKRKLEISKKENEETA
jgi:hypothetical protein